MTSLLRLYFPYFGDRSNNPIVAESLGAYMYIISSIIALLFFCQVALHVALFEAVHHSATSRELRLCGRLLCDSMSTTRVIRGSVGFV